MTERERLSNEAIDRLALALITLPTSDLAELREVYKAALRGSATAMLPVARAKLERWMAALEAIIDALGGPPRG